MARPNGPSRHQREDYQHDGSGWVGRVGLLPIVTKKKSKKEEMYVVCSVSVVDLPHQPHPIALVDRWQEVGSLDATLRDFLALLALPI